MDKQINLFPQGIIHIPSSKSIAHRAIICAGLADGKSRVEPLSLSQDIQATMACMARLGAELELRENILTVTGWQALQPGLMDCGESGSTLRFLLPIAGISDRPYTFMGQGRLMQRPLSPYLNALTEHGLNIQWDQERLIIQGPLQPGTFSLPGHISSQYVSGLLLALPLLKADSRILLTSPLQSAAYVDLTIGVMEAFGIRVIPGQDQFVIPGGQQYQPQSYTIESDYSQAAFFLVASALGAPCSCAGLNPHSKQGDRHIIALLKQCGVEIISTPSGLRAEAIQLRPCTVDASRIPDLVPPLAALLACCPGTSHIINAQRLRHKESDRLRSVTQVLNTLGADITEEKNGLTIHGKLSLTGGRVSSYGDHRIAMMTAVAAIRCQDPVIVEDSACVAKSYPNFWTDFCRVPKGDTKKKDIINQEV